MKTSGDSKIFQCQYWDSDNIRWWCALDRCVSAPVLFRISQKGLHNLHAVRTHYVPKKHISSVTFLSVATSFPFKHCGIKHLHPSIRDKHFLAADKDLFLVKFRADPRAIPPSLNPPVNPNSSVNANLAASRHISFTFTPLNAEHSMNGTPHSSASFCPSSVDTSRFPFEECSSTSLSENHNRNKSSCTLWYDLKT